jgi:hypothetical protein
LLPLDVVEKLVEIYEFGANKYGENNWRTIENGYKRCRAAMFRHLTAYDKGEQVDPDSGKSHLAHAAWNALSMVYFAERERKIQPLSQDMIVEIGRIAHKDALEPPIESYKLIEEFDENVLLYVDTFDGHQVLIKNAKGAQMFSLKHLYFISQPIKSLLNYKTVRTATEYEEAEYASYNKYKYKIGQPVMAEGAERPYPVVKREVSKRTLKRSYYLEPLGWYNEDEIIPYTNNQPQ